MKPRDEGIFVRIVRTPKPVKKLKILYLLSSFNHSLSSEAPVAVWISDMSGDVSTLLFTTTSQNLTRRLPPAL